MRQLSFPERGLEALTKGPEDGPLVLCLHGFPDLPGSFAHLAGRLAGEGYRVVLPFLAGYHPSRIEGRVDVETQAEDLAAWVKKLDSGQRVAVVGHDWGAAITHWALAMGEVQIDAAVTMAVPHPVAFAENGLVAMSQIRRSWYMFFIQLGPVADWAFAQSDFALVERLWHAWSPGFVADRRHLSDIRACFERSWPRPLDVYRETARAFPEHLRWREALARPISEKTPMLYLHGERDGCISSAMAAGQDRYFRGELDQEVVIGAGHFLHLERPEVVTPRIARFLARHLPVEAEGR